MSRKPKHHYAPQAMNEQSPQSEDDWLSEILLEFTNIRTTASAWNVKLSVPMQG